jgi:hypothetical protein
MRGVRLELRGRPERAWARRAPGHDEGGGWPDEAMTRGGAEVRFVCLMLATWPAWRSEVDCTRTVI